MTMVTTESVFLDQAPQPSEGERIKARLRLLGRKSLESQLNYLVDQMADFGQVSAEDLRREVLKAAASARRNRKIKVRSYERRVR